MPNKPNYQRALDEIIHTLEQKTASNSSGQDEAKTRAKAPRLLLHSCCAPCSSYVLEYLSDYFAITDFFYNPNIAPQEEYRYREEELKRLLDPTAFTGMAEAQCRSFLREQVAPVLDADRNILNASAEINV